MRYLFVCLVPFLFVSCSQNNISEDSTIGKYFTDNHVDGCFVMFDNGTGRFTTYNGSRFVDSAYLPASTFKIVNSLIGVETGRVKDSSTVIPWDHIKRNVPEWNQDLTMQKAFEYSAVPWYQELARRIGKDTMQHWLDTLGYGQSRKRFVIGNNLDSFWLDNSLKITPDEQLGLVKRLYFDQLPFQTRTQRIVRNLMKREENANYTLSYKTGLGVLPDNRELGWVVGFVEENRHPYFFVLQLASGAQSDLGPVRVPMLKSILEHLGFFKGKR